MNAFQAGAWRLAKRPELNARTFRATGTARPAHGSRESGGYGVPFCRGEQAGCRGLFRRPRQRPDLFEGIGYRATFRVPTEHGLRRRVYLSPPMFPGIRGGKKTWVPAWLRRLSVISIEQSQQEQSLAPAENLLRLGSFRLSLRMSPRGRRSRIQGPRAATSPTRLTRSPQVTLSSSTWAIVIPPWRTCTGSAREKPTMRPSPRQGGTSCPIIGAQRSSTGGRRILGLRH